MAKLDMATEEGSKMCKYICLEILESQKKLLNLIRRKIGHGQ